MENCQKLSTVWCSSLYKVLPGRDLDCCPYESGTALRGERFSFQLAYRTDLFTRMPLKVEVSSPFGKALQVRNVELVPVEYPGWSFDDDYLDTKPGLYPDRLRDLSESVPCAAFGQWRSIWFTVDVPENHAPGKYEIEVTLSADFALQLTDVEFKALTVKKTFTLEVLNAVLPEQKLIYTNWFHCDCLADYYKVEVFSPEHWKIIENFMKRSVHSGMNMILTPLFTPPLDTAVGSERPTVQLVDVEYKRGKYNFDFSKLEKWIALAKKCGIKYFEMNHLFSQWGAQFTPKIVASVNGRQKKIFGWNVKSDSPEYTDFLAAFLPELVAFLKRKRMTDKVIFHCSDEPHINHLEVYSKAMALLKKHLPGFKIMDALSSVDFYRKGVVEYPIPCENTLDDFMAENFPEVWTYYCCAPVTTYSNRFIAMPSSRNRVMGMLFYRYGVQGFLHWGYNFYYSQLSQFKIDPNRCTDANLAFPAGDAFIVYPGNGGKAEESIRGVVFGEAIQDQRLLQLLETAVPQAELYALLDRTAAGGTLKMADYPKGEKAILALREELNALVRKYFA